MNWDAITAIAEVIGVIAVVISLVYVGMQVRQNTLQLRHISSMVQKELGSSTSIMKTKSIRSFTVEHKSATCVVEQRMSTES